MSISSRITSIEEHIGNAYDKLDDLGIDLTGVDKNIDNIASMLDTVYEEYPKVSATGVTQASLNGTKVGKMGLDLKGNSTQDGTPAPDNEVPIYSAGNIQNLFNPNASDIETGKYLKTDGTTANSSVSNVSGYIAINPNVELNLNVTGDGNQRNILFYDSNKTYLGADLIQTYYTNRTFISPQNAYYLRFTYYKNATTIELKPSVGSISEKIVNKNLYNGLDNKRIALSGVSASTNVTTSGITTSGKAAWGNCSLLFQFEKNTDYIVSFKELDILSHKAGISIYGTNVLNYVNTDLTSLVSNVVDITANQIANVSATFNSGNYDYILFRFWNNSSGTVLSDTSNLQISEIQLELGSTATTYTAHAEQTYTIPCQQPMRKIGTVQDEFIKVNGEWKERHNNKSFLFDGDTTENWNMNYGDNLFNLSLGSGNLSIIGNAKSNYYIYDNRQYGMSSLPHGKFAIQNYGGGSALFIKNTDCADVTAFKTWLSTHNTEVIYQLATPVDLPCTSEQIAILENLPKSYNEQTNIYSLDVTPAYIEAKALKGE